jgi:hypothetical protein
MVPASYLAKQGGVMRKQIRVPYDQQGWLPVEPDALYLTLARLIARAQNLVQHPRADLVPVRPKRNVVRRS